MIDFHSHILPDMDDGSDSVETSLEMLRVSRKQGVTLLCATSHFYADEEDPASFLARRTEAWRALRDAMEPGEEYPAVLLGAEILFFPGISVSEEIRSLTLERTPFLLVEPPMMTWSEDMLEEIDECGRSLHCIPVIAHVDRYMRMLNDDSLLERAARRRVLIQFNAGAFLRSGFREKALAFLQGGKIHFLGSDCHDTVRRRPNLGDAYDVIASSDGGEMSRLFQQREARALAKALQR